MGEGDGIIHLPIIPSCLIKPQTSKEANLMVPMVQINKKKSGTKRCT
jgi:hypothetical protein